jgi:hypothetical protein
MRKKSPPCAELGLLRFLLSIFALASLLGVLGCGGGGSSSSFTQGGGGGGGGGGNVLPCTFNPPASGGSTSGAGVGTLIGNDYFGMHLNSEDAPWPFFSINGSMQTLPFGSQRLWDAGIAWSQVNTSSGVYDWTTAPQDADTWMSDAQAHAPLNELYTLARTPTWASSDSTDSSCIDSAENGDGQCHPPIHLNTDGSGTNDIWIAWVTAAAQYSKAKKDAGEPGFSYYEIWNEWNTTVSWLGTTQQLVRMEQDARCVVEGPPSGKSCYPDSVFPSGMALDSTAKIVSPSPVGAHPMLSAVADNLQTYFSTTVNNYAGGSFSDVIGFHGYVGTGTKSGNSALPCPTPEDVNTVIADMNTTLASFPQITAGKPLFNTEGGWSEADVEGFTDQDRQAAFLPRYLLLQQSANISRVYWYAWDSKRLSSLYNDTTGQATLAATAYGEVNKWTVGATLSKACGAAGTVWTCGFTRPGGYAAVAVWDASQDCTASSCPTPTAFPAGGYLEYRDVAGNVTSLGTATSVQIGAKPILLETAPLP